MYLVHISILYIYCIYCDDDAFIQIKQTVDMNDYKAQQTVASKHYCPVIQSTSWHEIKIEETFQTLAPSFILPRSCLQE